MFLFLHMKNYREGKTFRFAKQAKDLSSIEDKQCNQGVRIGASSESMLINIEFGAYKLLKKKIKDYIKPFTCHGFLQHWVSM